MKILFLTREPEICEVIAEKFKMNDIGCEVFDDQSDFIESLEQMTKSPDLLVLDYREYCHELFNIYDFLHENNINIPAIFYNDPFPERGQRIEYWECQCKTQYKVTDIKKLKIFFGILAAALESPEIGPYVSLLQPPLPFPTREIIQKAIPEKKLKTDFDIYVFKNQYHMSPSVFRILQILYKKRGQFVSVHYLSMNLKGDGKNGKKGSVYSYISRLRAYIHKAENIHIDIIQSCDGYKLIVY